MDDKKYYEERPDSNDTGTDSSAGGSNAYDQPGNGPHYQYQPGGGSNPYHYNPNSYQGQNPYDDRPPMRPKANPLALASFIVSIVSFVLCCCYPNFLMIGSFIAIGLAICSKFFYRETPMHGLAIAAIVIGCVGIILNICMLILSFVWLPEYLHNNPEIIDEMRDLLGQYGEELSDSLFD